MNVPHPPVAHPVWCIGRPVCTADQRPEPDLRPLHRGRPVQVPGTAGHVTLSLIQEPDGPPRLAVTSNGWAHTRTCELNQATIDVLIAELMRLADTAQRGLVQTPGPTPATR